MSISAVWFPILTVTCLVPSGLAAFPRKRSNIALHTQKLSHDAPSLSHKGGLAQLRRVQHNSSKMYFMLSSVGPAGELLIDYREDHPFLKGAPLSLEDPDGFAGELVEQRRLPRSMEWATKAGLLVAAIAILLFSPDSGAGHCPEDSHAEEVEVHRKGMTKWELVVSLVNIMMGLCLLAAPYCLSRTGVIGFMVFAAVGLVMCGTAVLLGRSISRMMEMPHLKGIPASKFDWIFICQEAFGRSGAMMAAAIMPIDLYFHVLNCILVAGHLLPAILPTGAISYELSVFVCGTVAFLVCLVPERHLARLMALGAGTQLILLLALVATGMLIAWMAPSTMNYDLETSVKASTLFGVVGVFVGSFNVHAMLPYFYLRLEDRSEWNSAITISSCITIVLIGSIGLACFVLFGVGTREIFAENLGHVGTDEPLVGFGFLRPVCCVLLAFQQFTMAPAGWQAIMGMASQVTEVGPTMEFSFGMIVIGSACLLASAGGSALPFIMAVEGDLVDFPIGIVIPILAFLVICARDLSFSWKMSLSFCLMLSIAIILPGEAIDAQVLMGLRRED